ncbi:hypothetical protein Tco_1346565 [Tanacetum coccineum]
MYKPSLDLSMAPAVSEDIKKVPHKRSAVKAPKKKAQTMSPSASDSIPVKKADSSTEKLLLTLLEEVKGLKEQIKIPSNIYPCVSQLESTKYAKGKQKTYIAVSMTITLLSVSTTREVTSMVELLMKPLTVLRNLPQPKGNQGFLVSDPMNPLKSGFTKETNLFQNLCARLVKEILLKTPRKDNMYSFDMKNIVPKESLTCLVAKDTGFVIRAKIMVSFQLLLFPSSSSDESVGYHALWVILFGDIPTVIPSTSMVAPETSAIAPVISSTLLTRRVVKQGNRTVPSSHLRFPIAHGTAPNGISRITELKLLNVRKRVGPLTSSQISMEELASHSSSDIPPHPSSLEFFFGILHSLFFRIDHRVVRDDSVGFEDDPPVGEVSVVGDCVCCVCALVVLCGECVVFVEFYVGEGLCDVSQAGEDSSNSSGTRDGIVRIVGIETVQRRLEADQLITRGQRVSMTKMNNSLRLENLKVLRSFQMSPLNREKFVRTTRLQDAVSGGNYTNNLMDQKLKGYAVRNAENKRRLKNNYRNNVGNNTPTKRQKPEEVRMLLKPIWLVTMRSCMVMEETPSFCT